MNLFSLRRGWLALLLAAAVWGIVLPQLATALGQAVPGRAVIRNVRAVGDQLLVTVDVAAGKRRMTLETRPRLQRGAWIPRDVKWSDGSAGQVIFALPLGETVELLRVRDDEPDELGLPAGFFEGPKEFAGTVNPPSASFGGAPIDAGMVPGVNGAPAENSGTDRAVVESDIWFVDGSTLYFFNQQRGLQVIDLATPDAPVLRGTLPLVSWGEQMYRLPAADASGATWLALLTQQGCDNNSEVLLVRVEDGHPALAGRLPVSGQIRESRLVGDALYVASYDWIQVPPIEIHDEKGNITGYQYPPWESRTVIGAFDLATPTAPVSQPPVTVAASPDAISATDRFLLVATTGTLTPDPNEQVPSWALSGNHGVIVFDISDPHGVTTQIGVLLSAGRVADKFKLNLNHDVLTVVSQKDGVGQWVMHTNITQPDGGTWGEWQWAPPQAVLETFSLTDPTAPVRLGGLTLVTNESVFATRFDGERAYVVTFHQVDPLWIVDLSDPVQPQVTAQLDVPGFSNYLQPIGSRLLAMGVESNRAAVSLFDVADPTKPALLSKVLLGGDWSGSEANYDEKAFAVFPEAGLVLVPWYGQKAGDPANPTWFQGVQLVDLSDDGLKARGVIDHTFQARRATLQGNRIFSISAQELLSVDATDRDQPQVRATLELAAEVDRVIVAGSRLVQVRTPWNEAPELTLTTPADADTPLARLTLAGPPVAGATWHDGQLYVLQVQPDSWRSDALNTTNEVVTKSDKPPYLYTNESVITTWTNVLVPGETRLSVVAAGDGSLQLLGQIAMANPTNFYGGSFTALWPQTGVVVWTEDATTFWGWPWYGFGPVTDIMPVGGVGIGIWYPWWGNGTRHFLAFNVGQPAAPAVASVTTLGAAGDLGGSGRAAAADGKVFTSHSTMKLVDVPPSSSGGSGDPTDPKSNPDPQPLQQWETFWWLDVLDYADAAEPVVRPPASLPGELLGVAHAGQILYTRGSVADAKDGAQALQALAYDGLSASLVSSLALPNTWPQPVTVRPDGVVWLGRAPGNTNETPMLETWTVTTEGQFARLGNLAESAAISELLPFADIMVVSDGASWFQFFDPTMPSSLTPSGTAVRPCGLWVSPGTADASQASGLWLPRGTSGLWHVPLGP